MSQCIGCIDKTVISDTSLSVGSFLTDMTLVAMVQKEAILLCGREGCSLCKTTWLDFPSCTWSCSGSGGSGHCHVLGNDFGRNAWL